MGHTGLPLTPKEFPGGFKALEFYGFGFYDLVLGVLSSFCKETLHILHSPYVASSLPKKPYARAPAG